MGIALYVCMPAVLVVTRDNNGLLWQAWWLCLPQQIVIARMG